jgi:hypothetical protein
VNGQKSFLFISSLVMPARKNKKAAGEGCLNAKKRQTAHLLSNAGGAGISTGTLSVLPP